MARLKIDYGIDLGTTNSAICRMEQGEPIIKKTDTLKDTMPSCVSVTRRGAIKAGDSAYGDMKSDKRRASKSWKSEASNAYVEFKRTMGTDKVYHSSNLDRDFTSEELSAEVLKTLKSFITDESVSSVVITVPAKFTVNQKTATMEAAKLAGFDHCELLQEPIAASMAYGLSSAQKDGIWIVFDFGGGTFDAALVKVEDGIMQVFDTEGDNYLGGKNLDEAIVDKLIVPYLQANYSVDGILTDKSKNEVLREAMKTYAEEAKNQLSFKESEDIISNLGDLGEDDEGEEIELDMTLTQTQVFDVMRPYFQKAVDICKKLLEKNNLTGNQLSKLILVGGPTHSPLIRQMLREQITSNVDTSIDPMTAVATGAALYASTIDAEIKDEDIKQDTIRLDVGYESTTVEATEWVSVKLLDNTFDSVMVELVRSDKAWSSGKTEVNAMGNVIEAQLLENKPNSFSIIAYDQRGNQLPCFPNEITIIQGSKVGSAVLPYFFAIAFWNASKKIAALRPLKGLEKNKPIPAVGVRNDLKTSSQLRPGNSSDVVRIPIYQSDNEVSEDGRKPAALYEYVSDVVITGEEVNTLIPEGSNVEITLKVDRSEMMKMEVFFPSCDLTIERELATNKKQSIEEAEQYVADELEAAQWKINDLMKEGQDVSSLQSQLDLVKDEKKSSNDPKRIMQHLKEVLRQIDEFDNQAEWPRIEKKLRGILAETERDQEKYGTAETANILKQLKANANQVIASKDIDSAKAVYEQLRALDYKLALVEYFVAWILDWDENFNSIAWRNPARARQLVNSGLNLISDSASAAQLQPIIRELISLMPEQARPQGAGGLLS